ncbi:MAG: PAS domain-containing protein [Pseudomonadota bacterium]
MKSATVLRPTAFHTPVRKARLLLANLPLFAGLLDHDGTVLECNFSPLGGPVNSKTDWIGKAFETGPWWNYSEDSRSNILIALGRSQRGEVVDTERLYRKPDGDMGVMRLSLKPLFAPYGQADAILVTAVDITDRRRTAETAESIANNIAHSLRESLSLMRSFASEQPEYLKNDQRHILFNRLSRIQASHTLTYRYLYFDVPIQDIVEAAIADRSHLSRYAYDPVSIPSAHVEPIMLALGELARPQYPANLFARRRGTQAVRIIWEENNPRPAKDMPEGLSDTLIRTDLEHRTQGTVNLQNDSQGFVWQFDLPRSDHQGLETTDTIAV